MKVAIMQPTYMPWAGYLALIAEVDQFVFLDDAQYERGTWQQRNRVLVQGAAHWLTVPVVRARLGDPIHRVRVDDQSNWRRKHLAMLAHTYARHPFRDDALELAEAATDKRLQLLADLNIALIEHCCKRMGLDTPRHRASALGIPGQRTQRVIALCESLGASIYVSPPGAREYLEEDGFSRRTGVRLEFHAFEALPYAQCGAKGFVSHLSILDVLANLGWTGATRYVKQSAAPAAAP